MRRLVGDLNRAYREYPALYARDCEGEGFEWLIADDAENSVFAWLRRSGGDEPPVAVISNFTPVPRPDYTVPLPPAGRWREAVNSDAEIYGGSGSAILASCMPASSIAWRTGQRPIDFAADGDTVSGA